MPRSGDADGYFAGAFCTGLGCPLKTVTLPFGEMTPWPPPGSTTLPFGVTYPPPGRFVNMTGLCDNYLVYFGALNAAFVSQEVFEQLHGRATSSINKRTRWLPSYNAVVRLEHSHASNVPSPEQPPGYGQAADPGCIKLKSTPITKNASTCNLL
jgi:hypothetical protein